MLSLLVIAVADGLSDDATTRALDAGPEYVSAAVGYPALFLSAGYERIDLIDVTDEYRMTLAAWVSAWDANSSELQQVLGDGDFAGVRQDAGWLRKQWTMAYCIDT